MGVGFAGFSIPDVRINQVKECFLFIIFEVFEFLELLLQAVNDNTGMPEIAHSQSCRSW